MIETLRELIADCKLVEAREECYSLEGEERELALSYLTNHLKDCIQPFVQELNRKFGIKTIGYDVETNIVTFYVSGIVGFPKKGEVPLPQVLKVVNTFKGAAFPALKNKQRTAFYQQLGL